LWVGFGIPLAGCSGVQSVLNAEGSAAEETAVLFWIMVMGGGLILLAVFLLALAALLFPSAWRKWLTSEQAIIGGGIVFPIVVLSALLVAGLAFIRSPSADPTANDLVRISVIGEQWWWRVQYLIPDGRRLESANEIRIPVGISSAVELTTADVIHSFWVPKLAGKLDMIPGRRTVLHLKPTKPGLSRGQCAEYCGGAHALMAFHVLAMELRDYESWLAREARPTIPPKDPVAIEGQKLFFSSGCGGCHAIRGTEARGIIGPDLTHVGGRVTIAAATLPNDASALARWIQDNQHIKPENRMPPFGIFTEAELSALSHYLAGLK
jgi:cytochrome c oxidase subunit 2